ncbi:MAG: UrcA family protein [Erythrobacter sp.]
MLYQKLSLAIFAAAVSATPLLAESKAAEVPSIEVPTADLDLTTKPDVVLLDKRIKLKIRQMCDNNGRDGEDLRLMRQCRSTALANAKPSVRRAIAQAHSRKVYLASKAPIELGS